MMKHAEMGFGIRTLAAKRAKLMDETVKLVLAWSEGPRDEEATAPVRVELDRLTEQTKALTARIEARRAYTTPKAVRERAAKLEAGPYVPDICL